MKKNIFTLFVLFSFLSTSLHAYKEIVVDLSEQMAYAIEDGFVAFEGRISSGVIDRETPNGEYRILQKKRYHRSNLWPKPNGGAKMNYMLRLSNSGIAMHLGHVPKSGPASHGCIRMENGFAQMMFDWARVGIPVYVEGDALDYVHFRRGYRNSYYADDYGTIDYHD